MTRALLLSLALLCGAPCVCADAPAQAPAAAPASAASLSAEARFAQMYIAPMMGRVFYRLHDPVSGMVEFSRKGMSPVLVGAGGWMGRMLQGDVIEVTPPGAQGARPVYRFRNGRPFELVQSGAATRMPEELEVSIPGKIPAMWDEDRSDEANPLNQKWTGRFAWPYRNPNRSAVLWGMLALVGVCVFLIPGERRKTWMVAGGSLGAVCAVLMVVTGSRGGLLAFGVGAFLIWATRTGGGRAGAWLKKHRAVVLSALVILGAAGVILTLGTGRKSKSLGDAGNQLRAEVFRAAPCMMVDAPGGWGRVTTPGQAYINWYQPIRQGTVTWTLISGHLTRLAHGGWAGRFGWVFGWCLLLAVLFTSARRGGSPLPLALWATFGVADLFNPVDNSWSLWIPPALSLAVWLRERPWRDPKSLRLPGVVAVASSLLILGGFWLAGTNLPRGRDPALRVDGNRILVKGQNPNIWVVDDGETLGWVLAGKDIRFFYSQVPHAPGMGFVRRLADLPSRVGKLVLAGRHCAEYLERLKQGNAPQAGKIVFLSPPFGPAAVPAELANSGRFMMVLGEFAAQYRDVYGPQPFPDWVGTVDGAEVYIPGWVGLATSN